MTYDYFKYLLKLKIAPLLYYADRLFHGSLNTWKILIVYSKGSLEGQRFNELNLSCQNEKSKNDHDKNAISNI